MDQRSRLREDSDRRTFLTGAAALGVAGLAGCIGLLDGDDDPDIGLIGSGYRDREIGGTPMAELPDLEGELHLYSGRNEFLVVDLLRYFEDEYEDFSVTDTTRYEGSTSLVTRIDEEGDGSSADVFFSVNAGALGALDDLGRTRELSDDVLEMVDERFATDRWVGTSGRARSVPYNTDALSEDDVPDDVMDFPEAVDADLGWAPSYGSCQAFVTAMRILEGEDATREWLEDVVDAGIEPYPDEQAVCRAIADGEIDAGFTNHYYIQRVLDGSDDAPLSTAFTEGDAGATFNVAGAAVVDSTDDPELAENFVRHLLSAEAQDYFARFNYEYPTVPDVPPVGDLPAVDELDVPDVDLTALSDLEATVDLMREVGIEL